eukprot:1158433-Pelagomonas_calceolata.AAC.14
MQQLSSERKADTPASCNTRPGGMLTHVGEKLGGSSRFVGHPLNKTKTLNVVAHLPAATRGQAWFGGRLAHVCTPPPAFLAQHPTPAAGQEGHWP